MAEPLIRLAALAAAVIPAFAILWYFLAAARVRIDAPMIWAGFGFGARTALPAAAFEGFYAVFVGFGTDPFGAAARQAVIGAAVPEEICKLLALLCLCGRHLRYTSANHVYVLAIATACGFACLENTFYVVNDGDWHTNAAMRSLTAVPGHAFMGAAMGFGIVQAVHRGGGPLWWILALAMPIAFHGLYNFPLLAMAHIELDPTAGSDVVVWNLVFLFIVVVVVEGVAAHLFLHRVLAVGRSTESSHHTRSRSADWLQRLCEFPVFWGLFGLVCWAGAGVVLWGVPSWDGIGLAHAPAAAASFRKGLAAFAELHGIAFLGLAAVVARRRLVAAD